MRLKLEKIFNHYYIYITYLIMFLVNIPVLDNLPYSDDFSFIFSPNHVTLAPNPFVYFFPWSVYFKSWALTYFVLWFLYKVFGEQVVYYRMFNLTIHFVNHLLFRKILKNHFQLSETRKNLFSLLFLFHPLSILTTNWIFQLKTLLAVLFFLLFYLYLKQTKLNQTKNYIVLTFLFLASLLSKVCAILFPIYLIAQFRDKFTKKKLITLSIILFSLSGIYGLFNIKGITWINAEKVYLNAASGADHSQVALTKKSELKTNNEIYNNAIKQPGGITMEINIFDEIKTGLTTYTNPLISPEKFWDKYVIALQNLTRFSLASFGLNNYFPIYETNIQTATNKWLLVFILMASVILALFIYLKNEYFWLALILFLPVSGLFYIPYMKFSYTSDHWFYPAMIFMLLGIIQILQNKKFVIPGVMLLVLFQYGLLINRYQNIPSLLKENFIHFKNPAIVVNATEYSKLKNDWPVVYQNYIALLDQMNYFAPEAANEIYLASLQLRNEQLTTPYYPFMAKLIIEKNDFQMLKKFNLGLSGILPDRLLDLTESLDAIYSHRLDEHTYQKTIEHLK